MGVVRSIEPKYECLLILLFTVQNMERVGCTALASAASEVAKDRGASTPRNHSLSPPIVSFFGDARSAKASE
jgi:hypothetical protein